ncbi:MAG: hypothetical protein KatS3mg011_1898 [Acidimicrobiia bacterium]|nr:MAG: hypothetical protein KatS3mg011_1898 [Acidimicrobiia bacterium]
MRRVLWLVSILVVACAQQAPPRGPLPRVAEALPEPGRCAAVTGDPLGASILEVVEGTAADGVLVTGDVVVGFGGRRVASAADLQSAVRESAVGAVVDVEVVRNGRNSTLEVELGENADGGPLLGVLARTAYPEVPLSELSEGGLDGGPLSRLVWVEDVVVALDPVVPRMVRTSLDPPDGEWYAVDGVVYHLDGPYVRGSDGSAIPVPGEALRLVGSARGRLLVASRDGAEQVVWAVTRGPTEEVFRSEEPVLGATGSPDGRALLLALATSGDSRARFEVASGDEVLPLPENLLAVFGWFSDQTVLAQPVGAALAIVDPRSGSSLPVDLPPIEGTQVEIWAVGDGVHFLMADAGRLIRLSVDPTEEARELMVRCRIRRIDLPGSARVLRPVE